jgi:hypothetical protein
MSIKHRAPLLEMGEKGAGSLVRASLEGGRYVVYERAVLIPTYAVSV